MSATRPVILFSTGCLFHLPLGEIASLGARAGFDGLELILSDPALLDADKVLKETAVCPVMSVHAPFRQWSLWGGHFGAWQKSAALARKLPLVTNITLHPPFFRPGEFSLHRRFAKTPDLAAILEADERTVLSLENLPWSERVPFGRDPLVALIQVCEDKDVAMTFDTCHLGVSGRDILDSWRTVPQGLVRNIHFSDTDGVREHLWPGRGMLPLAGFLEMLREEPYHGLLTLEVSPGAFDGRDVDVMTAQLTDWMDDIRAVLKL